MGAVNPSIVKAILNAHRNSAYVPVAFRITGQPSIALLDLLVAKGFNALGAKPEETAYIFLHGPLAHMVSKHLDNKVVLAANAFAGVKTMDVSSDFISGVLMNMDDRVPDTLPEEAYKMLALYDKIEGLDRMSKLASALRKEPGPEDQTHTPDIIGVAQLPNGDVCHMAICRDCAEKFINGEAEGTEFINKNLIRVLLGFFLSHIGGEGTVEKTKVTLDDFRPTEVPPVKH